MKKEKIKMESFKRMFLIIVAFSIMLLTISLQTQEVLGASSGSTAISGTDITISLINQDPDPAIAGSIVEIRLGTENLGGVAANNLVLELAPTYPFSLVPGESAAQDLGTLGQYQQSSDMKIVKYRLNVDKDVIAGTYDLDMIYYPKGQKDQLRVEKTVSIEVQNSENAEVIYIDKSVVIPGKESALKFTINNVGNAPLRDLSFKWVNSDKIILPVGSDNTKYIKYIDIGESAELEYKVIADTNADPGLYTMDLYLTYTDPITQEETTITTLAGIYVGGGTDFDVAFSESSASQTSFTIANIGSNPATSVSVIIPEQIGWSVSGSNSVIIGNLNKGDYTVATFSLSSSSSASQNRTGTGRPSSIPSEQSLPEQSPEKQQSSQSQTQENYAYNRINNRTSGTLTVRIAYTDTMGNRETIDKSVKMPSSFSTSSDGLASMTSSRRSASSTQSSGFFSTYKWYIVGIVVLAVAFFGYKKYNRKKIMTEKTQKTRQENKH